MGNTVSDEHRQVVGGLCGETLLPCTLAYLRVAWSTDGFRLHCMVTATTGSTNFDPLLRPGGWYRARSGFSQTHIRASAHVFIACVTADVQLRHALCGARAWKL